MMWITFLRKHLQKYIDTRGYVLYNSEMWRDKCAHN